MLTPILRKMLGERARDGLPTTADQVVAVLLSRARAGDLDAIKVIFERIDGKVPNPVDLTSQGQQVLTQPVVMGALPVYAPEDTGARGR